MSNHRRRSTLLLLLLGLPILAGPIPRGPSAVLADCGDPDPAQPLAAGTPVSTDLGSSTEIDAYVFSLTQSSQEVSLRLTDPDEGLAPRLDSACDPDGGGGRHVDSSGWVRDGDDWLLEFTAGSVIGDHYLQVEAGSSAANPPIGYDLLLYAAFRKLRPPEER